MKKILAFVLLLTGAANIAHADPISASDCLAEANDFAQLAFRNVLQITPGVSAPDNLPALSGVQMNGPDGEVLNVYQTNFNYSMRASAGDFIPSYRVRITITMTSPCVLKKLETNHLHTGSIPQN